jgi:uncharacterized protein (DUF3820 family)
MEAAPDPEFLRSCALAKMPYGKYRGEWLSELPEAYLVWFRQQGWPEGKLGAQLAAVLEIRTEGLGPILSRIRHMEQQCGLPP